MTAIDPALRLRELQFASNVLSLEPFRKSNIQQAAAHLVQMQEVFKQELAAARMDFRQSAFLAMAVPMAGTGKTHVAEQLFADVFRWYDQQRFSASKPLSNEADLEVMYAQGILPPMTDQAAQWTQGKDYQGMWQVALGAGNPYYLWGQGYKHGDVTQWVFCRSDHFIQNAEGQSAPDFTSAVAVTYNAKTNRVRLCATVGSEGVLYAADDKQQLRALAFQDGSLVAGKAEGRLEFKSVAPMQMHAALGLSDPDARVKAAHKEANGSCPSCKVSVQCMTQVAPTLSQQRGK